MANQSTRRTGASAPKENGKMPEFTFEEAKTFPEVKRISAASSQFLAPCEAMVKSGKSFRLPGLERGAADKVANNLRQIMKRVHSRSLSAVYDPAEKALYVRDGGEIKTRASKGTTAAKATAAKKAR